MYFDSNFYEFIRCCPLSYIYMFVAWSLVNSVAVARPSALSSAEGKGPTVAAQNNPKLLKQQRLWARRVVGPCPAMRGRVSVSVSGACVH